MKGPAGILAFGLAVLLGSACGKKGPLQLPLAREPKPVERLTAFQRGRSIILEWTHSGKYIDGRPLKAAGPAELWALEPGSKAGAKPPALRDFETRARLARRIAPNELRPVPGGVRFAYPLTRDQAGHRILAVSIRVLDTARRPSKFCPPVMVEIRPCPLPPEIADVRVLKDRVEISWTPPAANIDGSKPAIVAGYTVYRSEGMAEPEKLTPSPTSGLSFEDRSFQFGASYTYIVRTCATATNPVLESDDCAPRNVVPRDTFPPAPPAGLVAVPGPGVISLSWEPVRDKGPVGYSVWRKEEGGPGFVLLTPEALPENTFTDPSVLKGKTYVYAVSVKDKNGNESARTETGPVSLKGT
jgi:hypothetical protein